MSDNLIKIIAFVIIASVMVLILKNHLQEYSFLLVLAVASSALLLLLSEIFPYINTLKSMFEKQNDSVMYFSVALKSLGIAYITNFASSVCRDFGQTALAQIADIAGKGAIFILSIPLICAVLESAIKFAGL